MPASKELKWLLRRLAADGRRPYRDLLARLTRRETEVLTKLANGATYREIAHDLSVSPTTVGSHVQNIAKKVYKWSPNGGAGVREPRRTPPSGGSTWTFASDPSD
jgi:DNA-binding CsgD family transcriptional regulator